jgi:hypothetical protein
LRLLVPCFNEEAAVAADVRKALPTAIESLVELEAESNSSEICQPPVAGLDTDASPRTTANRGV